MAVNEAMLIFGQASHAADSAAETPWYVWVSYLVATALFVLALKWLSHPQTARRGVRAGEIGMAAAVVGTLLMYVGVSSTLHYVFIGMVLGSLIGAPMAIWMPMTAVPQRTALSHAFGALAAALVGIAHYYDFLAPESSTTSRWRSSRSRSSWAA
jgi:NAD(P) transhydrogenase subunit beta